jgi:hypothetical protein
MLHEGQSRHLVCRECRPAWEERRLHGKWRDLPPTPADLQAHHAAHATVDGLALWMVWEHGARRPRFMAYGVTTPEAWLRLAEQTFPDARWRPATADAVACPWPVSQPEVARP